MLKCIFIAMCSFARPFSIEDAMENGSPYSVQKISLQEFPFSPDISRVNLMSQRTSRMGARKGSRNCQYRLCSRPRGLPEPVFSSSPVQSAIPPRVPAASQHVLTGMLTLPANLEKTSKDKSVPLSIAISLFVCLTVEIGGKSTCKPMESLRVPKSS